MAEEEAIGPSGDGGRGKSSACPVHVKVVVFEVEVVIAPINRRVGVCEPRFAKNDVIGTKGVDNGVDRVGIIVAVEGDGGRVLNG